MRLNINRPGIGRATGARPAPDRVENMLRLAADFDPGIEPVEDFVRAALGPRAARIRKRRSVRPLALGFSSLAGGIGAAALLLFVLSLNEAGRQTIGVDGSPPTMSLPGEAQGKSVESVDPPTAPTGKGDARANAGGSHAAAPKQSSSEGAEEQASEPVVRHPRIEAASMEESRPVEPPETHEHVKRIPKVRWRNEVVQRYDRGVYAPAYMVEEKDRNGDVVYQPVMMPVTTETGARPLLIDGAPDTTIQWTSQSEESSHK